MSLNALCGAPNCHKYAMATCLKCFFYGCYAHLAFGASIEQGLFTSKRRVSVWCAKCGCPELRTSTELEEWVSGLTSGWNDKDLRELARKCPL